MSMMDQPSNLRSGPGQRLPSLLHKRFTIKCDRASLATRIQDGRDLRTRKAPMQLQQGQTQRIRLASPNSKGPFCSAPRPETQNRQLQRVGTPSRLGSRYMSVRSGIQTARPQNLSPRSPIKSRISSTVSIGRPRSLQNKCPLRIAELAEPSKRQCMATWRCNPNTLPADMLDRLQQRILDQKPIVRLEDAVNYFQIRRCKNRQPQQRVRQGDASESEVRSHCAIFARNMAKRLMRMKITPCTSVKMIRLTTVVSSEISEILGNRQLMDIEDTIDNATIQFEVATKIARWIVSVLDEADQRILEDQLKAKVTKERQLGKTGTLETSIEKYLQHHRQEKDLEEEEGPVLDFLDMVFENAMKIGNISSSSCISIYKEDNERFGDSPPNHSEQYEEQPGEDNDSSVKDEENVEPGNIRMPSDAGTYHIGGIVGNGEQIDIDQYDQVESGYERTDYNIDISKDDQTEEANDLPQTEVYFDVNEEAPEDNSTFDNDTSTQVSGVVDVDDGHETKKVKFSSLDSGLESIVQDIFKNISETSSSNIHHTSSHDKFMSENIVFAPPNQDLLSDADESWPVDQPQGVGIRFSESVSKSITSLGQIEENDEREEENDVNNENRRNKITDPENKKRQNRVNEEKDNISNEGNTITLIPMTPDETEYAEYAPKNIIINNRDKSVDISMEIGSIQLDQILTNAIEIGQSVILEEISKDILDKDMSIFLKNSVQNENITKEQVGIIPKDKSSIETDDTIFADDGSYNIMDKEIKPQIKVEIKKRLSSSGSATSAPMDPADLDEIMETADDRFTIYQEKIEGDPSKYSYTDDGKGDHKIKKQKFTTSSTEKNVKNLPYIAGKKKFDYRVLPNTAPAWAIPFQSPDPVYCKLSRSSMPHGQARRWCNDLLKTVENLEHWHEWIDNVCTKMVSLKEKSELTKKLPPTDKLRKQIFREWAQLKADVEREAALWTLLKDQTKSALKSYRQRAKTPFKRLATGPNAVLSLCNDLDKLSLWMHRLIVSTEYCMKCRCKYYIRQ